MMPGEASELDITRMEQRVDACNGQALCYRAPQLDLYNGLCGDAMLQGIRQAWSHTKMWKS